MEKGSIAKNTLFLNQPKKWGHSRLEVYIYMELLIIILFVGV